MVSLNLFKIKHILRYLLGEFFLDSQSYSSRRCHMLFWWLVLFPFHALIPFVEVVPGERLLGAQEIVEDRKDVIDAQFLRKWVHLCDPFHSCFLLAPSYNLKLILSICDFFDQSFILFFSSFWVGI